MELKYNKIQTTGTDTPLKIVKGHFATNHSHINYYMDMTTLKTRQKEAQAAAKAIVHEYVTSTVVDTIVCMDGTEVVGAYLAEELTAAGFMSMNAHQTIYVVSPELNSMGQLVFRDNLQPMIRGKHVLLCPTDHRELCCRLLGYGLLQPAQNHRRYLRFLRRFPRNA